MLDVVWLIPALPLAGFLVILLFGRRLGEPKAGYLATALCGGAFAVTVGVFADLMSMDAEERSHHAAKVIFSWYRSVRCTSISASWPIRSASPWRCSSPASAR